MNLRAEPDLLPPLLSTSEVGTFAHNTLKTRIPRILQDTIERNSFPPPIVARLRDLHDELVQGRIRALEEDAPDVSAWNAASAPWVGRTWLDVPWYFAEAYFYRRILEATTYFQPGSLQGFDPFASTKRQEWAADAAPATVAALLTSLPEDPALRLERLLHASLWGNRTDLSYMVAAHLGVTASSEAERANLLVDHAGAVRDFISDRPGLRVGIIADNAGTELLMDVALADFLLTHELAATVHMHLKPHPFFVSDAMIKDLADGVDALIGAHAAASRLGRRVDGHIAAGELIPCSHPFYTSGRFFFEAPDDLLCGLGRLDLVLVKGDANYRRLVGDAHWPPTTPFGEITRYFPTSVVALRTFKSELVVGLEPGQAERTAAAAPDWLINGQRGVIQARL